MTSVDCVDDQSCGELKRKEAGGIVLYSLMHENGQKPGRGKNGGIWTFLDAGRMDTQRRVRREADGGRRQGALEKEDA